ncbi:hypothetical protein AAHE18_04G226700 [Arachis hypogaea]
MKIFGISLVVFLIQFGSVSDSVSSCFSLLLNFPESVISESG